MKVLFTADLHIRFNRRKIPTNWLKTQYTNLFKQLRTIEADMLILGGDIFDKKPTLEELTFFLDMLKLINKTTIIYDGNHEATKRGQTFLSLLKDVVREINPLVSIIDDYYSLENMDFIPYCKLKSFKPENFTGDILFTHVRGDIEPFVKAEIDLATLDRWELVAAGDLHSFTNSQRNIIYPGSPYPTEFHREPTSAGVLLIDTSSVTWEYVPINSNQLLRKTVENTDDILENTTDDLVVYDVRVTVDKLGAVDKSKVDTIILDRKYFSTLSIQAEDSIQIQLEVYFSEIMKLEQESIDSLINKFEEVRSSVDN